MHYLIHIAYTCLALYDSIWHPVIKLDYHLVVKWGGTTSPCHLGVFLFYFIFYFEKPKNTSQT